MNKHKTTSYSGLSVREGLMICPECGESLLQADVETYRKCPFCDHAFRKGQDFEDYLLQPVVELWIRSSGQELFTPPALYQEQQKNIFL